MQRFFKKLSPARIIALGFALVILIGSVLLMLPISTKQGVDLNYIDVLYTSASAVCVTGLVTVDVGTAFTGFGQFVIALLIQIGGLGVGSVGAGIILAMGKKVNLKGRTIIKEASNLGSGKGIIRFIKSVFLTTLAFELAGAALSFIVFIKNYSFLDAVGKSLFHSIAAFNNAGFDNLGLSGELKNNISIIPYRNNVFFNIVTCALIFFGGIGFLVIREVLEKRFRWKRLSMHTKVVLSTSLLLVVAGTVLLMLTEHITLLGAFFNSVTARTAGFATYSIGNFSNAGLLVMMALMLIGASPGSTGGGIKTSTFFVLVNGIKASATNRSERAFKYTVPAETFKKAATITILALLVIVNATFLILLMEPNVSLVDAFFEMLSAFATVGLSTGITSSLSVGSKLLSIAIMYIGRLGPLTVATLWYFSKGERCEYPEGNIAIG